MYDESNEPLESFLEQFEAHLRHQNRVSEDIRKLDETCRQLDEQIKRESREKQENIRQQQENIRQQQENIRQQQKNIRQQQESREIIRQQEERLQNLYDELISREFRENLSESERLAEEITNSETFKERFCRIYQQNTVQAASDIAPIIVSLLSGLSILTAAFSILKIIAKRVLDEYCKDVGN